MNALKQLASARQALAWARDWAGMIGKTYHGGGGGVGRALRVDVGTQVYYQEREGSTNYHTMPDALKAALARAVEADFPRLLDVALSELEEERRTAAVEAVAEHAALMREAGVESAGGAL